MIQATKGVVLSKTNYSESSLVVQVYSEQFGRIALLVPGVKRRKSRTRIALFEPLSIIEFTVTAKQNTSLFRPNNVKLYEPFLGIQSDIVKQSLALFISEILTKVLREKHPEPEMFLFIQHALELLNVTQKGVANFHLVFLMQLTRYLGFYPRLNDGAYFDFLEGSFGDSYPNAGAFLSGQDRDEFYQLAVLRFDNMQDFVIHSSQRKRILDHCLKYYKTHISHMGEINSHHILEAVFH